MTEETLDLGPLEVDEFRQFWAVWPRRKDTARAEAAYWRARRVASAEEILAAAEAYAAEIEGKPAEQIRWAVNWLREEPWRPGDRNLSPAPAPTRRRRRRPGPRRAPRFAAPVHEPTEEEKRAEWCRVHGITVQELEERQKLGDREWLERIKRRGRVA